MTKILVLSPTPTHPNDSGNRVRIHNMLSYLKACGHEIHFLYCGAAEEANFDHMKRAWDQFHYVDDCNVNLLKRVATKFKSIFRVDTNWLDNNIWQIKLPFVSMLFKPFKVDDWYSSKISEALELLKKKNVYGVVLIEYVYLSKALELFNHNVLKIIDTHDVFANRHLQYTKQGKIPHFFYTTKDEETKGLDRADVVLAIQSQEFKYFTEVINKRVLLVGHVCKPKRTKIRRINKVVRLLFVGSASTPNLDALSYFNEEIIPVLMEECVDFECAVVGAVQLSHADARLNYLGRVREVETAYEKADIVINPIRIGTGLNIKSLEALSYGKPFVTTSIGAAGLEKGTGSAFLVGDSPAVFVKHIQSLIIDVQLHERMSKRAYCFAEAYNNETLSSLDKLIKQ